jgi:Fanconi-associated nuclease 1
VSCAPSGQRSYDTNRSFLSVWNIEEKKCRFVEVKSPNDHLSETQKVWISVMQSAGVDVEVCHVGEATPDENAKRKRQRMNNGGWGKRKDHDYGNESDLQEPDEDEDEDAKDRDQWQHEDGHEARSKWKGEGRLYRKSELQEEDGSEVESPREDKENFRVARERSRSVAAKVNSRPIKRKASALGRTPSMEVRGDVTAPIEL